MVDLNNEESVPGYGMDESMNALRSNKHLIAIFFFCVLLMIIMSPTRIVPKARQPKYDHTD